MRFQVPAGSTWKSTGTRHTLQGVKHKLCKSKRMLRHNSSTLLLKVLNDFMSCHIPKEQVFVCCGNEFSYLDLNAQQCRARACKSKWREYSLPVAGFSSSASKVRVTQGNSVVSEKTAAFFVCSTPQVLSLPA